MMTKEQVGEIWQKVQDNAKKLEQCPGPHDFRPVEGRKYRCTHCGGEVDVSQFHWYYQGLTHGRKPPQVPKCQDPTCIGGRIEVDGIPLGDCPTCRPKT